MLRVFPRRIRDQKALVSIITDFSSDKKLLKSIVIDYNLLFCQYLNYILLIINFINNKISKSESSCHTLVYLNTKFYHEKKVS